MKKWKIILVISVLFGLCFGIYKSYMRILPTMDAYGELALRQFCSAVAVHAKKTVFDSNINDELIQIHRNQNGEIESIDYDVIYLNQQTDEMVSLTEGIIKDVQIGHYKRKDDSRFEKYLENISTNDGIITSIPLESLIAFPPVSFLHWRIPIRYQTESNVVGKVEQRVESYGINNVLITLEIKLTVQQKMILPFFHDVKNIELTFPVAMKLIQGKIPDTYIGGNS